MADAVIDETPQLVWLSIAEPFRSHSQAAEVLKLAEVAEQHKTALVIGGRHASELDALGLMAKASRAGSSANRWPNSAASQRDSCRAPQPVAYTTGSSCVGLWP